ncbi:MAG TPA: serine/threonine-protein kinase [Pyrinomonadaceae bacterium]|nr:serine/threonine-protein kinase [Pyrinomonadaceae bacterium]
MTPEQWQEVEAVLQDALDCPPGERASFLDGACAGDQRLLKEANSLIYAYEHAGDFIEQPALTQDAHILLGGDLTDKLGSTVGPYKILRRLGVGGMGEVYLAEDERLQRLVALKILPVYFASDDARLRRFQREARAASALNHPNILTIHEVGETDGVYFIATEFIDGGTIRQLLAERELSLDEILDIAEQVASALAAAHAAGIVHRDIKPENIMRRSDGLVKILDFGIAKLMETELLEYSDEITADGRTRTEAGLVMGTVNYMSPEQARGLQVDERTDIWSLGVVVYEMLARRLPFQGATRMDTLVAILDRDAPSLPEVTSSHYAVSARLARTVHRCLRKSIADRFPTANELLLELNRLRRGDSGPSVNGPTLHYRSEDQSISGWGSRSFVHRYAWPMLVLILVLLAATAAITFYSRNSRPSTAPIPYAATVANTSSSQGILYAEMNETERLAFVREQEQRISAMMGDRPAKLNREALQMIKQYVDYYATRRERTNGEDTLDDIYGRAPQYIPLIARSFGARRVPVIIGIYLPVIESAYRPCNESSYGAKGLFQFLPQTAKLYGVSDEEMCDAEKMTPAAAHYLADHMAELGDDAESMTLVLLSYNTGAPWVRNTLRELRDAGDYERNFWTLFAHRDQLDGTFREEGARYVPNFFAAAIIGENPHTFGLSLAPLSSLAEKGEGSKQ